MRTHLKIFYDDLWAEHIFLSTGKIVKPFKDRYGFGKRQLSEGFQNNKPFWFKEVDNIFNITDQDVYIIKLADNRMMQGDYRYGNYDYNTCWNSYDIISEFWRRRKIALETKNLEYIVDMYNMLRIQAHKDKKIPDFLSNRFIKDYLKATRENWELTSIDDGIHAIEK